MNIEYCALFNKVNDQLTITGKKYFSTVPGVRTSAHDPNGLKK